MLSALGIIAEVGDFGRQRSITKSGKAHVRQLLVEAAPRLPAVARRSGLVCRQLLVEAAWSAGQSSPAHASAV
jgi:hypothetical protein